MRGCLFVVLFAALLAGAAAWFGAPALAGWLVEGALDGSGFASASTRVRVVAEPPVAILAGHADRVEITARDATFEDAAVDDLGLTLIDVDLAARRFASVQGTLAGVTVRQDEGSVDVERIDLSGPADAARAVVTIAGSEVERLAGDALGDRIGLPIGSAALRGPDQLVFAVADRRVTGRFVVEPNGGLSLAVALPGTPRVEVLDGERLAVESVAVLNGSLVLTAAVDLATLLG